MQLFLYDLFLIRRKSLSSMLCCEKHFETPYSLMVLRLTVLPACHSRSCAYLSVAVPVLLLVSVFLAIMFSFAVFVWVQLVVGSVAVAQVMTSKRLFIVLICS